VDRNNGVLSAKPAIFFIKTGCHRGGHPVTYWLRHYATSQKVAGSIPDEVIEFSS
jgi:hypothetical protein